MANEVRLFDANALQLEPDPWGGMNGVLLLGRSGGKTMATVQAALKCMIDNAPTVDAVEVVHGRWVWDVESHGDPMYGIDEDYGYRCSKCGVWADEYCVDGDIYEEPPTHIMHYCPNCGAKMDGGNEDG